MDVGVRDLKQNLSSYLARAAGGERILVTDRGRPRAMIVPVPGGDNLQRGIDEGWITAPMRREALPASPNRARSPRTIAELIEGDRDE